MFQKKRFQGPWPGQKQQGSPYQQSPYQQGPYQQGPYQQYQGYGYDSQLKRLEYQVQENTQRINRLNKRVRRIENYIGIRDDE